MTDTEIDYESHYYSLLHILKSHAVNLDLYTKQLMSEKDFYLHAEEFKRLVDDEFNTALKGGN